MRVGGERVERIKGGGRGKGDRKWKREHDEGREGEKGTDAAVCPLSVDGQMNSTLDYD